MGKVRKRLVMNAEERRERISKSAIPEEKDVIGSPSLAGGGTKNPAVYSGPGLLDDEKKKPSLFASFLGLVADETVLKQIKADPDSIFFFVRLPEELQKKLGAISEKITNSERVPLEEVDHLTLLYIPKVEGGVSKELVEKATRLTEDFAKKTAPIFARLQGWAYFDGAEGEGENKKTALVALVDAPGLAEAHVNLKRAMGEAGLPAFQQNHGFVPHTTVAYLPKGTRVEDLPVLGDEFLIDRIEMVHEEPRVFKLGGTTQKEEEPASTPPNPFADVETFGTLSLIRLHDELHHIFREQAGQLQSVEDLVNLHARVVGELSARKTHHPPAPKDELDDASETFEGPQDYPGSEAVEKSYMKTNTSGVEVGDEITLEQVLSHFDTFKLRKPYIYLVGGLATNGKTKGDIDILVKDSDLLPEDFKHALHFRLGRALPAELANRLSIHYDRFHGPFTNFVELYDLTFERVNPKNEVKEMSQGQEFELKSTDFLDEREKVDSTLCQENWEEEENVENS